MASEAKKAKAAPEAKTAPAPKKEAAPADKSTPEATPPKTEGSDTTGAAPKNYSRGEGQKPVTQAYKDNWNAIFGKKQKKKR
jgi:hypothetical protein